jgi:hypothetical protein
MQQTFCLSDRVHSQPDAFAGIVAKLVKEIVDLREALEFYSLQVFKAEIAESCGSPLASAEPGTAPSIPTCNR